MASPYHYGRGSMRRLDGGLHPKLYAVALLAITLSPVDFAITNVTRSVQQQERNVAKGVSKTMNSRHLRKRVNKWLECCFALDFVPWIDGKADPENIPAMKEIIAAFKHAAEILGVDGLEFGGEMWGWDWYHVQLNRKKYPARR